MRASEKITLLRDALKHQKLDGFIVPVGDEFLGEYVPACAERLAWLTDFTGSAGMAVVLADKAALFVDGRYTLQAAQQVDAALYEVLNSGEHKPEKWIALQTSAPVRIGYDPALHDIAWVERMEAAWKGSNKTLVPVTPNLIDALWQDRPDAPSSMVMVHPLAYAGEKSVEKRARLAADLKKKNIDAALLAAPESVNWLLNIRGRDLEFSPIALCRALLFADGAVTLYVDPTRADEALRAHVGADVRLCQPEALAEDIAALSSKRVLIDAATTPAGFVHALKSAGVEIIRGEDPCTLPKAIKNTAEIEGMRRAHIRDGLAVASFLHWLEEKTGLKSVSELECVEHMLHFRARAEEFVSPSFATISGSGGNGAIVHYRATKASNRVLSQGELFLLDSGGQYKDGTTDITRTMAIGTPKPEMKERYTQVLKGHIALALAVFPEGTSGPQLDALARQYLWQAGVDYDHGTGHGVGAFMHVHEGPQRISKRPGGTNLVPGMILSNEPGYYKAGEYGIRIENLVLVVEKITGETDKRYFGFEILTCAPLDRNVVEISLLNESERNWWNGYHHWVLTQLSPLATPGLREWLARACAPI